MDNFYFALGLTIFAGLSTGIGSLMAFMSKKFNPKFLAASLGFSAGVMIYVSFVEIFFIAKEDLTANYHEYGEALTVLSFFAGILLIGIIDRFVPGPENPHELKNMTFLDKKQDQEKRLMRMGLFSAVAIGIHNFPEGLATFIAALENPQMGISIAVAIAIHNIPEGIAISIPIYYATKNRKKAFTLSFLSGLSEPIGAIVGYFILITFFGDGFLGFVFAAVAGIMVYISLDELLPTAEEYGEHHLAIYGLMSGMLVMAISLLLL